uniref:Uncharacterized protein n=1 Tax=Candidozyma auris TaxID=498019 RepID=A0A0L0NQY2_CANAR
MKGDSTVINLYCCFILGDEKADGYVEVAKMNEWTLNGMIFVGTHSQRERRVHQGRLMSCQDASLA